MDKTIRNVFFRKPQLVPKNNSNNVFTMHYCLALLLIALSSLLSCQQQQQNGTQTNNADTNTSNAANVKDAKTVVYQGAAGIVTMADLANAKRVTDYSSIMPKYIPEEAKNNYQRAKDLLQQGNRQGYLQVMRQTAQQMPDWPQPNYDLAFYYVLGARLDSALHYYQIINNYYPEGYFDSKRAVFYLANPDSLLRSAYIVYNQYKTFKRDTLKNATKELEDLTKTVPQFGPAWHDLIRRTPDHQQRQTIITQALNVVRDRESVAAILIENAKTKAALGQNTEAIEILAGVLLNQQNTYLAREAAKYELAVLVNSKKQE